jgi:hypothetical protein
MIKLIRISFHFFILAYILNERGERVKMCSTFNYYIFFRSVFAYWKLENIRYFLDNTLIDIYK